MVTVGVQLCSAPTEPLSEGEAEAETASEDDVEAERLQLSFLAGGERRQGATRLRTGLGEDESPGVAESGWQDAMFLVVLTYLLTYFFFSLLTKMALLLTYLLTYLLS